MSPPKRAPPAPPVQRPIVPNPAPALWQPIVAVQERYALDAGIFEQINQGNIALAKVITSPRARGGEVEFWMTKRQYDFWTLHGRIQANKN
jgi:hypothetical protein